MKRKVCSIADCDLTNHALGLCVAHYHRKRRCWIVPIDATPIRKHKPYAKPTPSIITACIRCGKAMRQYESRRKVGGGKYCSIMCRNNKGDCYD